MKKKYLLFLLCICYLLAGCGKTDRGSLVHKDSTQIEKKEPQDSQGQVKKADKVLEKEESETEMTEEELLNEVHNRYYAQWSDEEMVAAINETNQYRESCSFYKNVIEYMENIREVRDIASMVEPLYYTDMKYYKSQDFEDAPLLIIHLAKNEIYARHGYIFKDKDVNNYFMGQLWYEPSITPGDFDDSVFNKFEKDNLKLLVELDTYK